MKLQTEVTVKPLDRGFTFKDRILFLGSCFAQEQGIRCRDRYFDVMVNPFGVLFNPASVSQGIGLIAEGKGFTAADVIETPSGFCSLYHHSSFAKPTAEEFLNEADASLKAVQAFWKDCGWVVVTLGTSFIYRHLQRDVIAANCHKLPAADFERRMLSVDEVSRCLSRIMELCSGRQVIFTVSPVRHVADGLHQNQLSKATLLLAVDQTVNEYANAHYFPSYEILADELRDYRFYADDMAHPSPLAADIIFDRFMDYALDPSERGHLSTANALMQKMRHRPLNPSSPSAQEFIRSREIELNEFLTSIR